MYRLEREDVSIKVRSEVEVRALAVVIGLGSVKLNGPAWTLLRTLFVFCAGALPVITLNDPSRCWTFLNTSFLQAWCLPSSLVKADTEGGCPAMRRALRLVFYAFFATSASVGALIATTQVIAALGHAPSALPLNDVAQSLGIDIGAVIVFVLLFRSDFRARLPLQQPLSLPRPVVVRHAGKLHPCAVLSFSCPVRSQRMKGACKVPQLQQASVLLQM